MILKLALPNETFGNGWKFIDGITRVNSYKVNEKPKMPLMVEIKNTEEAQKNSEFIAFDCLWLDCLKDKEDYQIYTELPAFLINDKGETIERLN